MQILISGLTGGGAAGSSAAYHLRNFSHSESESSLPISITLFESASRIGGRTTTVDALDDPRYPTELGASIFVEINHILHDAAVEFNLSTDSLETKEAKYSLGVWDGDSFIVRLTASEGGNSWWDVAKLVWRYGLAPYRTQKLMQSTIGRFLRLYEEPLFPFRELDEVAARVGLVDFTASTGKEILMKGGVSEKFSREIIQASTRVNYGQNIAGIHGLETLVCMSTDGAMSVDGGNWQIFDRMVKASGADVRLNTTVANVEKESNGTYTIQTKATGSDNGDLGHVRQEAFDVVLLAAPYQFSNIKFSPSIKHVPDTIPYVRLHVTLFTSPHRISPSFFKFDSDASEDEVPQMILTTLPEGVDLGSRKGKEGVGPAGFWSVNLIRKINSDNDAPPQYLYKVFSPEKLTAPWMSDLLGLSAPIAVGSDTLDALDKESLSWHYEKVWDSYPYELPRQTFERTKLDERLWYSSGIESFISTMETSALMGKNIAKLIVDEVLEETEDGGWTPQCEEDGLLC